MILAWTLEVLRSPSSLAQAACLDLGAEWTGYQVRAAVEWDRDSVVTMEKNFSHLVSPVIQKDILKVPTEEILAAAGLSDGERPDLLIGGPPCTPFSKSGFWLTGSGRGWIRARRFSRSTPGCSERHGHDTSCWRTCTP